MFSIVKNKGIGKHPRRIFTEGELEEKVLCKDSLHTTPRRAQVRFPHTWLTTPDSAPNEPRNSTP